MPRLSLDMGLIRSDPRWRILCRNARLSMADALWCAILVWDACYSLRQHTLPVEHIDVTCDRDGFAREMINAGLAVDTPEGVRVCGVEERIQYLLTQHERGRKGGQASAQARLKRPLDNGAHEYKGQAVASRVLKPPTPTPTPTPTPSAPDPASATAPDEKPLSGDARPGSNGHGKNGEAKRVAQEYVDWFNRNFQRAFTARADLVKLVGSLMAKGYTLADMKAVSWIYGKRWMEKPEMAEYVVPASLLRTSKFGMRLDEANELRKRGTSA